MALEQQKTEAAKATGELQQQLAQLQEKTRRKPNKLKRWNNVWRW